jgi:hypothetical protein
MLFGGEDHCLLWESYETLKYNLWVEWFQYIQYIKQAVYVELAPSKNVIWNFIEDRSVVWSMYHIDLCSFYPVRPNNLRTVSFNYSQSEKVHRVINLCEKKAMANSTSHWHNPLK